MKDTSKHDECIAKMTFSSFYPHYVTKVEKKGRTREEVDQVIQWLTGFDKIQLESLIEEKVSFQTFFEIASMHPNLPLIKDAICGNCLEKIENSLTQFNLEQVSLL